MLEKYKKIHLADPVNPGVSICGKRTQKLSVEEKDVNCKICRRDLQRGDEAIKEIVNESSRG